MTNKRRRLGWISVVETLSFLGLLGAMFTHNEAGVSLLGALHGVLFLAYAFFLWMDHADFGWRRGFAIACILTGPIGAIVVLEKLRQERGEDPIHL